MSDEKVFSGSILRVFEARAKPGCADSLAKKFATTSVDVVRNQPGNQGHFFGKSGVAGRGPLNRGRVIDLSLSAARALGMNRSGVVPVSLD